jgi:hypothetical protein
MIVSESIEEHLMDTKRQAERQIRPASKVF